eukprot:XP_023156116.1 uncharacterized protein LOC103630235 [Zea mays]
MNAARIREGNLLRADRVATAHKAKPREFQIENRVDNKRANASKGMNKDATSKCSQQINYQVIGLLLHNFPIICIRFIILSSACCKNNTT